MNPEHGPLPPYDVVGPRQNPELLANIANHLETLHPQLPPEIPHPPELRAEFTAMNEALIAYGADLGVDLSNRTTSLDRVHIFDDAGMEEIYAQYPDKHGALGFWLGGGELVLKQMPPEMPGALLQNINHELIHGAAMHDIYPTPKEADGHWDLTLIRNGFHFINEDFFGYNEYFTEKINRKIKAHYWDRFEPLRDSAELVSTELPDTAEELKYDALMEFGEKVDQYVTEKLGEGILIELERSYFTGESDIFKYLSDRLGLNFTRGLLELRTHLPTDINNTATQLGLNEADKI